MGGVTVYIDKDWRPSLSSCLDATKSLFTGKGGVMTPGQCYYDRSNFNAYLHLLCVGNATTNSASENQSHFSCKPFYLSRFSISV
jgi:hypothetical protein